MWGASRFAICWATTGACRTAARAAARISFGELRAASCEELLILHLSSVRAAIVLAVPSHPITGVQLQGPSPGVYLRAVPSNCPATKVGASVRYAQEPRMAAKDHGTARSRESFGRAVVHAKVLGTAQNNISDRLRSSLHLAGPNDATLCKKTICTFRAHPSAGSMMQSTESGAQPLRSRCAVADAIVVAAPPRPQLFWRSNLEILRRRRDQPESISSQGPSPSGALHRATPCAQ